jgi:predicted phage terminase large subunit-like protein
LTRWHVDDPIGRLLERDKSIKVLTYKAIATEDEAHRKKGEALFPELKSLEYLEGRRINMTGDSWESLFQQSPFVSKGGVFRPAMVETIEALPAGNTVWVRGWDFAASARGDYTVGAKMGRTADGRFVIADVERGQYETDGRDKVLVNTAKIDGASVTQDIPQDPGQAGKSLVLYLTRQLAGHKVKSSPESGDKVTRAEPFASQMNAGNVMMLRGGWNAPLIEELRMFPNGKYDDQVDALSRCFASLVVEKKKSAVAFLSGA